MKSIVVRHRNSGYTTLITPHAEDSKYWYVLETKEKGKKVLDALRYSKIDLTLILWEKSKIANLKTTFNQSKRRIK